MEKKEISMKEYSELLSLDRHFIWADHFKAEHYKLLDKDIDIVVREDSFEELGLFFLNPTGMYMCYWYATLYTVLEGLDSCKVDYKPIEKEVNEVKDSLRLFRNVIFHHQKGYFDARLFEIMKDKDSRKKILKIHNYLDTELQKQMKGSKIKEGDYDFEKLFKKS